MATLPTLAVCCVCKHVAQSGVPSSSWTPMSTFLERHRLQPIDVRLTHTYCPVCYEQQAEAWAIGGKGRGDRTTPRAA
jgi:hypothetical protein